MARCRWKYGIQSRLQGYAVLDDSQSFALTEDGWFAARLEGVRDLYFFGYGYAYREALRDFYHLCGAQPLLPRFALGNWWSRYRAYTAEEYLLLMDQFAQEGVPLSVAVVDMDWHITQPPGGGKGWNRVYMEPLTVSRTGKVSCGAALPRAARNAEPAPC